MIVAQSMVTVRELRAWRPEIFFVRNVRSRSLLTALLDERRLKIGSRFLSQDLLDDLCQDQKPANSRD